MGCVCPYAGKIVETVRFLNEILGLISLAASRCYLSAAVARR